MHNLETQVLLDILEFTTMTHAESKHDEANEKSGHKIRNHNDAKSYKNDNMRPREWWRVKTDRGHMGWVTTYDQEEKFLQQSASVLSMYYECGNK